MRHKGFTLIELVVVIVIVLILAALLFPIIHHPGEDAPRTFCQSNLKQIGLGLKQYAQDYDERLPPIAVNAVPSTLSQTYGETYGWADALQPYIKSTQLYHCPLLNKDVKWTDKNPQSDGVLTFYTDYYYNTNLDKIQQKYVNSPMNTILCGEGNDGTDGTDARYNRNVLPQKWIDTENSPARRHKNTANYLFADGHVKAIKPAEIKSKSGKSVKYHFSIK